VIDHAIHLGLPDGTDITGFEFVWLRRCNPGNPTSCQDRLALLFSVNEDDFMTPANESGGLDPRMIYASFMMDENGDGIGEKLPIPLGPAARQCGRHRRFATAICSRHPLPGQCRHDRPKFQSRGHRRFTGGRHQLGFVSAALSASVPGLGQWRLSGQC
jgi:hypothetical protein